MSLRVLAAPPGVLVPPSGVVVPLIVPFIVPAAPGPSVYNADFMDLISPVVYNFCSLSFFAVAVAPAGGADTLV